MRQIDLYLIGKHSIMRNVLAFFNSEINGRQLILDCGCGRGVYADNLPDGSYAGLDINSSSIRRAHRTHSHGMFVGGDATKLPFKDRVFNCVICSEVLEHIPDDKDVLAEVTRVLKVPGKLVISVPNLDCKNVFVNWQRNLIDEDIGHFRRGYSGREISELIITSGLKVEERKYGCGPITALIECFVIKIGGLFGYSPSNLDQLHEGRKSFFVRIVLRFYELVFPFLILVTHLDRLLPERYRSNMVFLAEKCSLKG